MKRKIIKIDEDKCNGCGECVPDCPEGALKVINGKARVVNEVLCDGLGACIGRCPRGAITIEEREAQGYSESKVMDNVVGRGKKVLSAHLKHLKEHGQKQYLNEAKEYLESHKISVPGLDESHKCPGMRLKDYRDTAHDEPGDSTSPAGSRLQQWPIQLQLLNPRAPYLNKARLLIAADCSAFSYANFHEKFLKGKILIIFCPKLDKANDLYVDKLKEIFIANEIKSITILHMEVPCCFGTVSIVNEALRMVKKDIPVEEITIGIRGDLI